jgi:hypothetical protein
VRERCETERRLRECKTERIIGSLNLLNLHAACKQSCDSTLGIMQKNIILRREVCVQSIVWALPETGVETEVSQKYIKH